MTLTGVSSKPIIVVVVVVVVVVGCDGGGSQSRCRNEKR